MSNQEELFGDKHKLRLERHIQEAEAVDRLFADAIKLRGTAGFIETMDFGIRMNRFSAYNLMLIYQQRPGAAVIATRRRWEQKRVQVMPGALPVVVLQPGGPISFQYELGDTSARLDAKRFAGVFAAAGRVPATALANTMKRASELGVLVNEVAYGADLAGTAHPLWGHKDTGATLNSGKWRWRVQVNSAHDDATKFATLTHELGHIYCGHLGAHPNGYWPDRSSQPRAEREAEAEAVCYLTCNRQRITTRSAEYLESYLDRAKLDRVSHFWILMAADQVEGRVKGPTH